jgi:PIN domain nuclease of toxin-antitoxin system
VSFYLLDTHAFLWWVDGTRLSDAVVAQLTSAMTENKLLYSSVSMWEIGMLESKEAYSFLPSFNEWCVNANQRSGANCLKLSADAAILASRLPGNFHKDPADRLLVASAMDARATFVTRDLQF